MSTEKPSIAILEGIFNDGGQNTAEFKEYSQRSTANVEANGGKLLGKYIISENLAQGEMPFGVFIVEFPSREVAKETFTNEEYKSIIPLRNVAYKEVKILLSDNYES